MLLAACKWSIESYIQYRCGRGKGWGGAKEHYGSVYINSIEETKSMLRRGGGGHGLGRAILNTTWRISMTKSHGAVPIAAWYIWTEDEAHEPTLIHCSTVQNRVVSLRVHREERSKSSLYEVKILQAWHLNYFQRVFIMKTLGRFRQIRNHQQMPYETNRRCSCPEARKQNQIKKAISEQQIVRLPQ